MAILSFNIAFLSIQVLVSLVLLVTLLKITVPQLLSRQLTLMTQLTLPITVAPLMFGPVLPVCLSLILILLTLMVSSKGIAAVPRASLVVITATLAMFDLPVEGVALVFAIDHFLDMGRTATNVVGNAVATSVITKWEGMLEVEEPIDADWPHAPAHTAHRGARGLDLAEDMVTDERTPPAGT